MKEDIDYGLSNVVGSPTEVKLGVYITNIMLNGQVSFVLPVVHLHQ